MIEVVADNKTNIMAVKKQLLRELETTEIPLKELVVYNVAKKIAKEKLKDSDPIKDID